MRFEDVLKKINHNTQYQLTNSESQNLDLEKLERQIYLFEYFLLQLNEIRFIDNCGKRIDDAITYTAQYLTDLYKLHKHSYLSERFNLNINTSQIRERHKKINNIMLFKAAKNNDEELFEAALASGAQVNFCYNYDYVITAAVKSKNFAMVQKLIEREVDLNVISGLYEVYLETPLISAVDANDLNMVKLLIANGADVNKNIHDVHEEKTALYKSCFLPSSDITKLLLSIPLISLNDQFLGVKNIYHTVLAAALGNMAMTHDDSRIKCLLKTNRIKQNDRDFFCAIYSGMDAVNLLLNAGYVCTASILEEAIDYSDANIIDLLVMQDKTDIEGARLNVKLHHHYTDLMYYTAIGKIEEVECLLAQPITDMEAKNDKEQTALMIAAEMGRTKIALLLLNAGASVDQTNHFGVTSLMLAAHQNHADTVKLLLDHQADVNKQVNFNDGINTALLIATKSSYHDVVECLLNVNNIDVSHKTDNGDTAIDLGLKSQNQKMVEAYKIQNSKSSISDLEIELRKKIQHFRDNGSSFFDMGSHKKANKIQKALNRAAESRPAHFSLQAFLHHKVDEKESIMDALSYNRIGLFGTPDSKLEIENFVALKCSQK